MDQIEHFILMTLVWIGISIVWSIIKAIYHYMLKEQWFRAIVCLYTRHEINLFDYDKLKKPEDVINHDHFVCKRCQQKIKNLYKYEKPLNILL